MTVSRMLQLLWASTTQRRQYSGASSPGMTEQGSCGRMPPAFAFIEQATPGTSCEGGEGASGTCDDYLAYIDEYINDALKALNRQTDATDVNDATDSGSTNYALVEFTASADHAWPRTSHADIEKLSSPTRDTARNPQTTRVHQSNTEYYPTAGTSTIQVCSSSGGGKYAVASTSHVGTEEASDLLGNDARVPDVTGAEPWSTQYYVARGTTTVSGHTHVTESGRASSPFMASSSSVNPAQTSTSRAGMEEASAVPENIARNAPGTGGTEQRELCGVCGNVSSRLDALHGHAREPTDDIAQICKACGQSSVKMSKFVEHCRDLTGKKQKCETCGKQFHRAHHLAQHHCTDTDEKLYKCKMCDKSFRHSHHLKIHKRTHTDERPHKCQICAKSFRQSSHLDKHKRTHTDERPYKCQICNKWFRTSSHLDTHKRQHTGEKPYICKTCGKSYARAESLHGHEHAHAEEKPHACQKCGKSFSRKYNLKRHADSHC
ncbi:zinc finger and SCAN domain-containing protein 22-like isoform X3 [Dermacentor albipictus]|uniref:zinc finger and SCAN domain-containing protein 22-like isoform X3 n=1 Tax=Dermacentor albipictus TaxID=60249 RepID=UPI0038FD0F24